jgi:periplasmic protein TonB
MSMAAHPSLTAQPLGAISAAATTSLTDDRADDAMIAAQTVPPDATLFAAVPLWRIGLGVSVLLHGVAVATVLFGPTLLTPRAELADSAITVEIAPAVTAPPDHPREIPPGPRRIEAVAMPHPVDHPKIPPPPKMLVLVKADVILPANSDPQPERPVMNQVADQTTAPQAMVAPSGPAMAAPTAGAATSDSNSPQTWEGLLLAKLERNKRYPSPAQANHQEDVVYLRMVINRAGRLTDANVVRSRGFTLLDKEVVALAHRASPYPAPPATEGDPVVVVVPVEFFLARHPGG